MKYILLSLILSFSTVTISQEVAYIECIYSHSINDKGESSPTSGEDFFTVHYLAENNVKITMQGLGAEFSGKASESEIIGETSYMLGTKQYGRSLSINRFTGNFHITFGITGQEDLIHFGKCSKLTKKLF